MRKLLSLMSVSIIRLVSFLSFYKKKHARYYQSDETYTGSYIWYNQIKRQDTTHIYHEYSHASTIPNSWDDTRHDITKSSIKFFAVFKARHFGIMITKRWLLLSRSEF